MSTIATLTSTETGANSLTDINANYAALNADKIEGPAASVDSEVAIYSGTGGKTLKRASSTGIAKLTSGVLTVVTAPSGALVGDTDSQSLSNKTLTTPTIASFANATHTHTNAAGGGTLAEAALALTDITTNDATSSRHGFLPKLPNDASKFLDGTGAFSTPSTGASLKSILVANFDSVSTRYGAIANGVAGTSTSTVNGLSMDTAGNASDGGGRLWGISNTTTPKIFQGSPAFTCRISVVTKGTDGEIFVGLGDLSAFDGSNKIVWTTRHIGFAIKWTASGTISVYATQANGTTETISAALTTIVANDVLDLLLQVNSTTSVDYYYRKNGGSLSSATNQTTNMPTESGAGEARACFVLGNFNAATTSSAKVYGASYQI